MNNVMIDVETLGTVPGAVILSIGAVRFDLPTGLDEDDLFYRNILTQSAIQAGLTVNGATVDWWLQQSDEARAALWTPKPIDLMWALSELRHWYGTPGLTWSHGSNFDLELLAAAYRAYNQFPPWQYRDVRDTRTLFWLAEPHGYTEYIKAEMKHGAPANKHDALADALRQVAWVQKAYQLINAEETATN